MRSFVRSLPGRHMWSAKHVAEARLDKSDPAALGRKMKELFGQEWAAHLGAMRLFTAKQFHFPTASMLEQNTAGRARASLSASENGSELHVYDPQALVEMKARLQANQTTITALFRLASSGLAPDESDGGHLDSFILDVIPSIDEATARTMQNRLAIVVSKPQEWLQASRRAKVALVLKLGIEFVQLGFLDKELFELDEAFVYLHNGTPLSTESVCTVHAAIIDGFSFSRDGGCNDGAQEHHMEVDEYAYQSRQHLRRGVPVVFRDVVEVDLRCFMVLELLLQQDLTQDNSLVVDAKNYGKFLRGVVYQAFKGTEITIPMTVGGMKGGPIVDDDLSSFMMERDSRFNKGALRLLEKYGMAVKERRKVHADGLRLSFGVPPEPNVLIRKETTKNLGLKDRCYSAAAFRARM